MSQLHLVNNGRRANGRYPELVKTSKMNEQEAAYHAALELVARIDEDLTRGVRHYRNKAGLLLNTLDEVIHAILNDDLLVHQERRDDRNWHMPQELAA